MSTYMMKEITTGLKDYYVRANETERIILNAALAAAAADAVGGIIPGLAIPAIIISCFGAVWTMYASLCTTLGISLKENVLKLLAKAALANITANLGGVLAAMLAGMFIPGASILASAAVSFIAVYLAGVVFLRLILKMAEKSSDPYTFSDISAAEMKEEARRVTVTKEDLSAAKSVYATSAV
ncbi:MAG: hypothetical protein K2L07_02425 [Lachnospiraceae bacterium]|nr:hypothetical protein [Lachnospiraceae bacterium]